MHRVKNRKVGGVAIYAKHWLATHIKVARTRRECGMLWVQVNIMREGKPLFVGFVYLPPEGSSHYKQSDKDLEVHFSTLKRDIAFFRLRVK
jgi:hypothetical protein